MTSSKHTRRTFLSAATVADAAAQLAKTVFSSSATNDPAELFGSAANSHTPTALESVGEVKTTR